MHSVDRARWCWKLLSASAPSITELALGVYPWWRATVRRPPYQAPSAPSTVMADDEVRDTPLQDIPILSENIGLCTPRVSVGQIVDIGMVLYEIQQVKIDHQFTSHVSGKVLEVLKHAGDPVEYHEPVLIVRTPTV